MHYKVLNPLLSVRASTDPKSDDYGRFVEWHAGDVIEEHPPHTDIDGWLEAVGAAANDGYGAALVEQHAGDGHAYAAGCAGDDGRLAGEDGSCVGHLVVL